MCGTIVGLRRKATKVTVLVVPTTPKKLTLFSLDIYRAEIYHRLQRGTRTCNQFSSAFSCVTKHDRLRSQESFLDLVSTLFSGLSYGSIYPALKKMENHGLVSKRTEIQDGAPNRKIYTITDAGRVAFLDSLRSPLILEQPKSPLTEGLLFAHLSPEERHTIADKYLKSIEEFRGQLEAASAVEAHADRFQETALSIRPSLFPGLGPQCI